MKYCHCNVEFVFTLIEIITDLGYSSFTLVRFYIVDSGDEEVSVWTAYYNLVRSFRAGTFRITMPGGDSCSMDANSLQSKRKIVSHVHFYGTGIHTVNMEK